MSRRLQGFTLVELLTVLAILTLLAGLLFPVFQSVKASAQKSECASNIHQAQIATMLYMSDYDDFFMPINHRPGVLPAKFDRTWVQMILPYAKSFAMFHCPSDSSPHVTTEASFDEDLIPGDIYSKYYAASMRVNYGYNYIYLSPVVFRQGHWSSEPRSATSLADPSSTLLFVDSIWDRTADGQPIGGGNWLVVPPCRYGDAAGTRVDSFNAGTIYTPSYGWVTQNKNSARLYGNAWPWHGGLMNMARVDGSVKAIRPTQLVAGCSVKEGWQGTIVDPSLYLWDSG